jgi:hypothetical protein
MSKLQYAQDFGCTITSCIQKTTTRTAFYAKAIFWDVEEAFFTEPHLVHLPSFMAPPHLSQVASAFLSASAMSCVVVEEVSVELSDLSVPERLLSPTRTIFFSVGLVASAGFFCSVGLQDEHPVPSVVQKTGASPRDAMAKKANDFFIDTSMLWQFS